MNINNKPRTVTCVLFVSVFTPKRTDFVPRIIFRAFYEHQLRICGPGYFSLYSDSLHSAQSGERFLKGGEIVRTRLQNPWDPNCLLYSV